MLQRKNILYLLITAAFIQGCTKLEEPFRGDLTETQVGADSGNTASLLLGIYNSLQWPFCSHIVIFPLQELSTDEAIAPTRGQDWDDNGVWRVLHQHKWDANNDKIKECFNALNGISYAATDLLRYHPTAGQQAEARFIRAWVMYLLLDLYDQVPYRDPGENLNTPARVRKGKEALEYIISEIYAVETDLDDGPPDKANKFAARVLLMKCFLNKAVYISRANPPTPQKADMDKVVSLADTIIRSGKFSFTNKYFDNFAPDNTSLGKENIFTILNERFKFPFGFICFSYCITLHYNSYGVPWGFAGFNGFSTLSDFYDKFEPTDKRRGDEYSSQGSPPNPGKRINVGLLAGQQFSLYTNDSLQYSGNKYLNFTREVKNIELGANLESTGIRAVKYFPDFFDGPNSYFSPDNDFVFFRFADVLLMKAEAILKGGTPTNAGQYGDNATKIVNSIRTDPSRNASALSNVTPEILLDERGREMWWEGWRRQDLIRFGKFLQPYQERTIESGPKYLLYPIPAEQMAVNPNLVQNPGY